MGAGFKDFTAGEILTAADVDDYLMRQGIMAFDNTTDRDTALAANLEQGMHAYARDIDAVHYYNGTLWRPVFTQWTAFTPVWNNLTEGNATNTGHYRYRNGDLEVQARLIFGDTTSITGDVTLTIPNSEIAANNSISSIGTGVAYDASSNLRRALLVTAEPNATTIGLSSTLNGANVNVNIPMIWTNPDELWIDTRITVD